jgi:hypothetical protein
MTHTKHYIILDEMTVQLREVMLDTDYGFSNKLESTALEADTIEEHYSTLFDRRNLERPSSSEWYSLVRETVVFSIDLSDVALNISAEQYNSGSDNYFRILSPQPHVVQMLTMLWYLSGSGATIQVLEMGDYNTRLMRMQRIVDLRRVLLHEIEKDPDNAEF